MLTDRMVEAAVDAAMVEMKNLHPPLRRSDCEVLIRAALSVTTHKHRLGQAGIKVIREDVLPARTMLVSRDVFDMISDGAPHVPDKSMYANFLDRLIRTP